MNVTWMSWQCHFEPKVKMLRWLAALFCHSCEVVTKCVRLRVRINTDVILNWLLYICPQTVFTAIPGRNSSGQLNKQIKPRRPRRGGFIQWADVSSGVTWPVYSKSNMADGVDLPRWLKQHFQLERTHPTLLRGKRRQQCGRGRRKRKGGRGRKPLKRYSRWCCCFLNPPLVVVVFPPLIAPGLYDCVYGFTTREARVDGWAFEGALSPVSRVAVIGAA